MKPGFTEIPFRSMFVAAKDHLLVSFDLSQAESWVVAYLANEPNMKWALANSDIHLETAVVLFGKSKDELLALKQSDETQFKSMRYIGKRYNHASAYRMSYLKAAQVINADSDRPPYVVVTNPESKRFSEKWQQHYLGIKGWWNQIELELSTSRKLITPYGRERTFFGTWGNELFKEATAFVPQSVVADHLNGLIQPELGIKGGLMEVYHQYVETGIFTIVNQSHDSFIAEVHKDRVEDVIEPVTKLIRRPVVINNEMVTIPVDCEVGERWGCLTKRKVA